MSLKRLRLCTQHIKNTSQVKATMAAMELLEKNRLVFKGETSMSKGVLTRMGQWVEESLSLCPDQSFSEVLEGPCSSLELDLDNSNLVGKETAGGQPSC